MKKLIIFWLFLFSFQSFAQAEDETAIKKVVSQLFATPHIEIYDGGNVIRPRNN